MFSNGKIIKPYTYHCDDYMNKSSKKLELHKEYLKEIEKDENGRMVTIENKTSQLISQTGLIFSLLSLFVPFIINKVLDFDVYLKVLFILALSLAYLFYILAINNALKNFNVKKFNYVKSSPKSVISKQKLTVESFLKMEIKDSLVAINNNIGVNNLKASNLIFAHNSFKIGNIFTSILVIFLCAFLLFIDTKPNGITIENQIEIEQFNEYLEILKERNAILKDREPAVGNDTIDK